MTEVRRRGGRHPQQPPETDPGPEGGPAAAPAPVHPFPPATPALVTSLALVIVGGIWMASYFPRQAPLALPSAASGLSAVLLATAVAMLVRFPGFSWATFGLVWRWALLAYVVIAGMIEFAFVHNGASGAPLALITVMLVIFALDVATLIAMTVARYQRAAP
ncbi:MAG TPA: hypothetical protein VFH38_03905 [Jatrophihabitans sp.]|nr:hypothetical protein [Jatrophihabitans sp.]